MSRALTLIIWAVLAAMPLVLGPWELATLAQLLAYGIAAMSLSFIWGNVGLVCFGQAVFFGSGAYLMATVSKGMLPLPASTWLGLVLAVAGGAAAAALLGLVLFFGRGLRSAYFGIVTIALAVIAERVATNWSFIGGFNGLVDIPPLPLGPTDSAEPVAGYLLSLGAAFGAWLLLLWVERSPLGTVLRGIRSDERRVASLGYDAARAKLAALSMSGAVAGLGGALFALQFAFVSPAVIGLQLSTEILIWTAVGGKAVLLGSLLAALAVKWIEAALSQTVGHWWLLIIGLLFVAVVVVFPRGLFGRVLNLPLPRRLRAGGEGSPLRAGSERPGSLPAETEARPQAAQTE